MKYLISPDKKQYKANFHCHSIHSDGKHTPEELKEMYKNNGYSILAITDHESPISNQDLADPDFVMIDGYEVYIRDAADGKFRPFQKEVHLNFLAKEPNNLKMIARDRRYTRYLERDGILDQIPYISEETREYSTEYINHFIKTANENGYLVTYNHNYWSLEEEATTLSYEGFFSMEMANYSSLLLNGLDYNALLYDKMCRSGKRVYCHGADDNHNKFPVGDPASDSFGAFTMVMTDDLSYSGVISALENGDIYSSMGPVIHSLAIDGNKVQIKCSGVSHIFAIYGGKKNGRLNGYGNSLTEAEFEIPEGALYIRISLIDENGKRTDSRAYFPDEFAE